MVIMKAIIDSFSRCLGSQYRQNAPAPGTQPDTRRVGPSSATSALPLGTSRDRLSPGPGHENGTTTETGTATGTDQETNSYMHESRNSLNRASCYEIPLGYQGDDLDPDRENADILASARKKAAATRRHYKSPNATTRMSSFEKARHESIRRKLDIFRKSPEKHYSFSTFLGPNSALPQMLCFANPIFDSTDDDAKFNPENNDFTTDEETIASTVYFDAKHEHLTERCQPIPLMPEFSVPHSDSNDDIIQIFNNGTHKTVKAIFYGQPNSLPPDASTSMMDDTSSCSESSQAIMSFSEQQFLEEHVDCSPVIASCIPYPPMCRSRNELDTVEEMMKANEHPPGLKLMSKSSNSTVLLTPVNSSKSLSPRQRRYGERFMEGGECNGHLEKRLREREIHGRRRM